MSLKQNPFRLDPPDIRRHAQGARRHICRMNAHARSGHTGGDMSEADILATLYFRVLRYSTGPMRWHDQFILSKGHGVGGLYGCFAELGWLDASELNTYLRDGGRLPGHPVRQKLPELITVNTGGLGHGLPIATGLAMSKKRDGDDARVFVLTGDGELEEGSNWEAMMAAAHYKLGNLVMIVDRNHLQLADFTRNIMDIDPLDRKLAAFGMEVHELDGNDTTALVTVIESLDFSNEKPKALIAHTIKGRGVSFMENQPAWHHKFPDEKELIQALEELADA